MSQENVEALRAVYAEWAEGNFRAGEDLLDQRMMFIPGDGGPPETAEAGFYIGPEGFREFFGAWLKPWTNLTITAEEYIEAESSVVVAAIQRGTGAGSGAAAELRQFHVWTFRAKAAIRYEVFRDRAEALEAVGLSE
jgi:ketosteroid isomerase-like protein